MSWKAETLVFFFRGILKCKGDVTVRQNEAVVNDGAVRILPHLQGFNFHDEYFSKLGYNPFYTGKQIVLNMFSAFPLRKDFALKEQLDWVIMHLQAGGFWHKWNSEMFNPKVLK